MPIYHYDFDQYSEYWDRIKIGIPSSSGFDNVITPLGEKTKKSRWTNYAHSLIAERLLGRRIDTFMSPWMERGHELESSAVLAYETRYDIELTKVGFVTTDDGTIGCSPDRLVGEDGLLEIKVPKPNTQVGYLVGDELPRDYFPQLQGQLLVTGREWVDVMAYYPEPTIPFVTMRIKRDEEYIDKMRLLLDNLISYIEEKIELIKQLNTELK